MTQVIRNRYTDEMIYSSGDETMKEAVERAVREGVDLSDANLMNYEFTGANFAEGKFSGANFAGSTLQLVNFIKSDLRSANFYGSNILSTNFFLADLSQAEFSYFDFEKTNIEGAIFKNTKLFGNEIPIIFSKPPIIIQLNESGDGILYRKYKQDSSEPIIIKEVCHKKRRIIYIFENYMQMKSSNFQFIMKTLSLKEWKTTPPSKIFSEVFVKNLDGKLVKDRSDYIWWKANKSWILKIAQLNGCSFEEV